MGHDAFNSRVGRLYSCRVAPIPSIVHGAVELICNPHLSILSEGGNGNGIEVSNRLSQFMKMTSGYLFHRPSITNLTKFNFESKQNQ